MPDFSRRPRKGPRRTLRCRPWSAGRLYWERWVSAAFLQAYLERARGASFLPLSLEEREILLDSYLLEKAVYELGYELNNRPDWVRIPLQGIRQILGDGPKPE